MNSQKKFIVSHAPFCHNGSSISERSYHTMLAALPAVLMGCFFYGVPAIGVVSLSIALSIGWELLANFFRKQEPTIGDGNAALIGLVFGMLLPATAPYWVVLVGTFITTIIGKHIFGGIGGNPFNPVLIGVAILMVAWKDAFNFDQALLNFHFDFPMAYALKALKSFGVNATGNYSYSDLLLGRQSGGIGSTFGIGLILGGIYLIIRGFIRWEISLSFLAGVFITALLFHVNDPASYASPYFHLISGYTLIGAFFLAPEDSSSPVNFIPMLIYGAGAGFLTILIRNVGAYPDGVVFAIILMNLVNPLIDKIKPIGFGKVK